MKQDREQIYLKNLETGKELSKDIIYDIFNEDPTKYIFRHQDCPYVFITDGYNIFATDMDEQTIDPIQKYGLDNIIHIYNDFEEFLRTFTHIQNVLKREIYLSTKEKDKKISINELRTKYTENKKVLGNY
ncbi:hypothetical protein HOK00_08590 [bacterium]|jgi:hypothetical protein|nr:hypothetical protein [bacterium]